MKKKFNVITIGSAVKDFMFTTDQCELITRRFPYKRTSIGFGYGDKINIDDVHVTAGGGACNTAVNFAHLGLQVAPVMCISKDDVSEFTQKFLHKKNIFHDFIQESKKYTAQSIIITVPVKNEKEHILFHYLGAGNDLKIKKDTFQSVHSDIVYICSLKSKTWKSSLKNIFTYYTLAKKRDNKTLSVWNPGNTQISEGLDYLSRFLKFTDVLIVNRREAYMLICSCNKKPKNNIKQFLKSLHEYGSKVVIITDGKNGAYAYDGKKIYFQEIFDKVATVDTTGVGDAFGSTFTYMFSKERDIQKALQYGVINAAYVSSKVGAQYGSLSQKKLDSVWKKYFKK